MKKEKKTTRKQRCGTDNVDRAMSWILAVEALLGVRAAKTPQEAVEMDQRSREGFSPTFDVFRSPYPIFSRNVRLFVDDLLRSFPKTPKSREDLREIRILLVDEFDIPSAFREIQSE